MKSCRECGTVFELPKGRGQHRKQFCSLSCGSSHRYKTRASILRKSTLKRRYGLSEEDYKSLSDSQENKCALCQQKVDILYVDHCHETLRVRGLLCMKCNCLLGLAKDNKETLERAIKYLDGKIADLKKLRG